MEMRPSFTPENHKQENQIPLFVENIPQEAKDLTQKNREDLDNFLSPKLPTDSKEKGTLSGADYLRLSRFALEQKISSEVLSDYLLQQGIHISSGLPPEPQGTIRLH